ncbi:PX domain-containing protein [Xylaria digitata]|nr:PX domain-containing protein [Xylaria digitata]
MALATDHQSSNAYKGDRLNGNSTRNKDFPMPNPQPPPSPPVTETEIEMDTDRESTSIPLPPSTSIVQESRNTKTHTDLTSKERNLPDSEQGSGGPTLRLDTTMEGTASANASTNANNDSQSPIVSPVASPPYWTARGSQDYPLGHGRTVSSASVDSLIPAGLGITLRDNENSSTDDRGDACWAKSVEVTDYVIVNGSATNIGAFVVWNIRVETLSGSYINIRKRYSEFEDLRWRLMRTFPGFEAAVPELPPKSIISKFRPKFLEKRRAGLQYFLTCIMLNPEFSGSPVLKEFLFS